MSAVWAKPLVAAAAFLALALLLCLASRRRRLGAAFMAITAVIAAIWIAAGAAVRSDYHDADGYVDCWPSCTVLQDAVGLAIWFGPILFIALGVVAASLAAITRRHGGGDGAKDDPAK